MIANSHISIEIKNVSKRLRGAVALDDISASFTAATIHGLIGPDGAGKTTLLRMLMGLLRADSGEINYCNDISPKAPSAVSGAAPVRVDFSAVRPSMAYMPQQQCLYPDLSCEEHLEFFRDLYQIPREIYKTRRDELLHLSRLTEFRARPAGKLSGGMYKKLGLICALLQSPSVVLLDEPTNGVDPISRREFWEMIHRLAQDGILVIMSTAYMDEAERCDRVHMMEQGKFLAQGEPRELLAREGVQKFEDIFLRRQAPPAQS